MIEVRNLTKRYGNREVLRGISFDVRRGEALGLLGGPGSGKSTVLRLLASVLEPTAGRIEVVDPDVPVLPGRRGYRALVGYVPEPPFAFDYLTGREMLYFMATLYHVPVEEIGPRARYYLDLLAVTRHADELMLGYSRAMRRKIGLIGSLLHRPLYWLLDEPAESLDPDAIRTLVQLIGRMRSEGRSVVVSTRDYSLARSACDRVVILNDGAIAFDGPQTRAPHAGVECDSPAWAIGRH